MTTLDFKFDSLTRTQYDNPTFTQENIMNTTHANYTLFNPFNNNSTAGLNFATQQPNVFINGTYHLGPLGCNVKESTDLNKSILTNQNMKISLHERPYKTVPFLGKGNVDVGQENSLRLGDTMKEKKSVVKINETQYVNLNTFPCPALNNNIEHDAMNGWVRGGIGSREMYKNGEYYNKK